MVNFTTNEGSYDGSLLDLVVRAVNTVAKPDAKIVADHDLSKYLIEIDKIHNRGTALPFRAHPAILSSMINLANLAYDFVTPSDSFGKEERLTFLHFLRLEETSVGTRHHIFIGKNYDPEDYLGLCKEAENRGNKLNMTTSGFIAASRDPGVVESIPAGQITNTIYDAKERIFNPKNPDKYKRVKYKLERHDDEKSGRGLKTTFTNSAEDRFDFTFLRLLADAYGGLNILKVSKPDEHKNKKVIIPNVLAQKMTTDEYPEVMRGRGGGGGRRGSSGEGDS